MKIDDKLVEKNNKAQINESEVNKNKNETQRGEKTKRELQMTMSIYDEFRVKGEQRI